MPFNPNLPTDSALIVSAELRTQFNGLLDATAPIGCVKAWMKNFPGVPALATQWAECNGQVLSYAGSPLNGQTLPDLNNGRFLRGAGASGGTGGSEFLTIASEIPVDNNLNASTTTVVSGPQPDLVIMPPLLRRRVGDAGEVRGGD